MENVSGGGYGDGPPGPLVIARDDQHQYTSRTGQHGDFRIHVSAREYSVRVESKDWHVEADIAARNTPDAVEIEDGKCVALELRAVKPKSP